MAKSRLTLIKGDRRTAVYKDWTRWLQELSKLIARFDDELEDDPLSYNETASVSLLAAAAAKAGYLGIAEFSVVKRHRFDRRHRANGRCDFWMRAASISYGFEFKQTAPGRISPGDWNRAMEDAVHCAECLQPSEPDVRVAGLIVSLWHHDQKQIEDVCEMLKRQAQQCDFAWRVSGIGGEASDSFLYFTLIPEGRLRYAR